MERQHEKSGFDLFSLFPDNSISVLILVLAYLTGSYSSHLVAWTGKGNNPLRTSYHAPSWIGAAWNRSLYEKEIQKVLSC
jgi:hypothetical protein